MGEVKSRSPFALNHHKLQVVAIALSPFPMWHPYSLRALAFWAFRTSQPWASILLPATFGLLLFFLPVFPTTAQTCVFDHFIRASDDPFGTCPPGTDTIIIRDSFLVNVNYEPIIGFIPFQGVLLVDGGTIQWTANAFLKLGANAKVVLINGGKFRPLSSTAPDCNTLRALYFDTHKVVDCNGSGAPHAFSDVNSAGCVTIGGICCNAYIVAEENSGIPNDRTICQPGDTVRISVITSGELNYSILWFPDIGVGKGPHVVTPTQTSSYRVQMSAIFRPYDGSDAYLLQCQGLSTVTLNTPINATATATAVPCVDVPTGALDVTVSGGVAPYTYKWSNGAATKNLTNVRGGSYTVTITDSKGCEGVHTFTVPVDDDEPPTLSCPPNAVGVADPGKCTTLIPNIDATFSDNCPTVGVTYSLSGATTGSGEGQMSNKVLFFSGITTATYRVDDGANIVTCTFTVRVDDTQPPVVNNLLPLSGITCPAAIPTPNPNAVTASDNCGITSIVHVGDVTVAGGGCPSDTLIMLRTYRAFDAAGNSATATQLIRVVDNLPPTFTFVPANVAVSCEAIPAVGTPAASDNCSSEVTIAYSGQTREDGPCPDTYTLRRRWIATDGCGNSTTAEQIITVQDNLPPAFTSVPPDVTVSCSAIPAVGSPTATDNCDVSVSITYDSQTRADGNCPDSYILRRRWSASDNCGNTATAEQVIVVQDFTPPAFTSVPAHATVSCDAIPLVGAPAATDNCDAIVSIAYDGEVRTDGACPNAYTLTRQWTATDNCGNMATTIQVLTVRDLTPPVFTNFPSSTTVSCDAVPSPINPTASDNCAIAAVTYLGEMRNNGICPNNYTLLRTWQAADACGNTIVATQTLTVRDTEAPNFTFVPTDITTACDAIPPVGNPVAIDACIGPVTINYDGQTRTDGSCPDTYALTRRWTAADQCGNTRTAQQTIAVRDITPPIFVQVPADITVSCEAIPPVGVATASDNCDANVSVSYEGQTRLNGTCSDNYTLVRRWVAVDNCGNTAGAQQIIAVRDLTPPVFTFAPPNATVNCEAIPSLGTPSASDNCDTDVLISFLGVAQTSGSCASGGTVTRRWMAADNCGNTAVAEQVLSVQDTTRPVFVFVPADATVSCDAIPTVGQPQASDNCTADVEINYNGETRTDGPCADTYTLRRRWTATDLCGNTTLAEQVLTVRDLTPPAFTFVPADVTVSCELVPPIGTPAATDNCDADATITFEEETRTNGICPDSYILTRRWTATDNCGNTTSAIQRILVRDETPPTFISFPNDITVNCDDIPAPAIPTASDNCAADVLVSYNGETRLNGPCPHTYTLKRQWTAVDKCSNTASAVQTIVVQDIVPPAFTFVPADLTVSCDAVPAVGMPTASDNCTADVAISFNGEARLNGSCPDAYVLQRRWTATDECGNVSTALQTIAVQDVTPPLFTFVPPDLTVNCDDIPSISDPIVSDNCDASVSVSLTTDLQIGTDCSSGGVIIRRWTAMDNCSNTATAEQRLMVQDTTKPVFTFVPADLTVSCDNIPSIGSPVATDNCTASVVIAYDGEMRTDGPCADTYTLTRRWTATDVCGNAVSTQQIITVRDTESPVFTFVPPNMTVSCELVPPVGTPTASDNCDTDVTITFDGETRTDGPCSDTYTLTRRWTAHDNCGNTTATSQKIVVHDLIPPLFTFVPASVTVSCENVPPIVNPTATDNCDADVSIILVAEDRGNGPCPNTYTLTRRWVASDNCGNSATAEQVVAIQDITPPTFTSTPANTTVECNAVPAVATPIATDNCTFAPTLNYLGETRIDGNCSDTYTLIRRWTATDECGNVQTTQQMLLVRDVTPPVFTSTPADATVSCDAVPIPAQPQATDNCDADVFITYDGETIVSQTASGTYLLRRQWTATDNCNNTAQITQDLTVKDTVPPSITCPLDVQVPANGLTCSQVVIFDAPIAADNCDSQPKITGSVTSGVVFPIGTVVAVFQAVDDSGNSATCSFRITVADTTAPQLVNCPTDFTVTTPAGACETKVFWDAPYVVDACDPYPILPQSNIASGSVLPTGQTVITYAAQDSTGNVMSCSFVVTVQEDIPPVLVNCPANIVLYTNNCSAVATWSDPQTSDNCSPVTLSCDHTSGSVFPETTTFVTYTATDQWGNTATCSFAVIVIDTVPPTFSGCPKDTVLSSNGACSIAVDWKMPTATDNCAPAPVIIASSMPGDAYPVGHTLVKVTVEDPSGNQDICTFKITVIGPPLGFTDVPNDQSFIGCSAVATWTPPTPTGVCAPATVTSTHQPGDTFPIGTTVVVYMVSDTLGYSASFSFTITVTESVPPVFNCPTSPVIADISGAILKDPSQFLISAQAKASCDGATLTFDLPTATDNCGAPAVEQIGGLQSGAFFPVGAHALTFRATDAAGNTDLCSVTVVVEPLKPLAPQISDKIGCSGDDIVLSTPVIPGATYLWTGPKPPYPNSNNLIIENLSPALTGIYTVQAVVNGCYTPVDTALVRIGKQPKAVDDLDFEVETGGLLEGFSVLTNDIYEDDDFIVTVVGPLAGLTELGDGLFTYQAGPNNGRVNFIYRLCSAACPDLCSDAVVTITVRESFCTYIPNVITPNDDGINDYLEIPCLNTDLYPNNRLIIYNQWGDKVYEASPYDNDPAKAWRGTLNGRQGQNLPDGTYFYYFQPAPDRKPISSYIEIFR